MSHGPRIVLFTGKGKGKTTAALGMVLRAVGHGMRTLVIQFCKGNSETGELAALANLPGAKIRQVGLGWVPEESDSEFADHRSAARTGLEEAKEALRDDWDMVVLDEVCYAVRRGLLAEDDLLSTVRLAGPASVVVLTGRGASERLVDLADTVTEMRCVKHGRNAGRDAQPGVEF